MWRTQYCAALGDDSVSFVDERYERPEQRLLPVPADEASAFWTGGLENKLLIYRCNACGHWFHPPAPACFRCRSTDVAPQPASGRGTVATFTINRQQWLPAMPPPYVIALIEIDEEPDVRILSNVVGVPVEQVRIGLPVEVFFENWDDVSLPLFRPVEGTRE